MGLKVTNNAFGTLNAGINSSVTTLVLAAGQGALFPTLTAGDYFYATLIDTSNNLEIVKVTARSTDTMTIVRAQDNTTARAYSTNDRFELRPTAALFNEKANDADVIATYLPKAGGTMTGDLGVGATPLARMHATKAGAEVARFTNSQSNGGDWEFKLGGNGFENRKLMITDKFGGADNVRLSIDDGGRVRMPNQPTFSGVLNNGTVPGSSTKITSITASVNTGSHFNSGTGNFTCPVAGRYLVSATVMKDVGIGNVVHVDIYRNGTNMSTRLRTSAEDSYVQSSISSIVECAANDTISFYWFGGCNCLTTHDSFLITLLN